VPLQVVVSVETLRTLVAFKRSVLLRLLTNMVVTVHAGHVVVGVLRRAETWRQAHVMANSHHGHGRTGLVDVAENRAHGLLVPTVPRLRPAVRRAVSHRRRNRGVRGDGIETSTQAGRRSWGGNWGARMRPSGERGKRRLLRCRGCRVVRARGRVRRSIGAIGRGWPGGTHGSRGLRRRRWDLGVQYRLGEHTMRASAGSWGPQCGRQTAASRERARVSLLVLI
jgi:hypothetical protein